MPEMDNQQSEFVFNLRTFRLHQNANGYNEWQAHHATRRVPADQCAIIICDMWDNHWSRGAAERVDSMAPRMNQMIARARNQGAHIIHAPSNTLDFYADHPARRRMQELAPIEPPTARAVEDPPLPINNSDPTSDTGELNEHRAWSRQHSAIEIDPARDGISDQGAEVYSYLRHHAIQQVLLMGVHTNMCVLNRSFAIKQMVRWGVEIALVRDLTDAMYNPAMPPYVSHDAGTQLVVGYIERFWCPTITAQDLAG
ncbi:MAG: isochorismatase family protein [Litorilinea sp.]